MSSVYKVIIFGSGEQKLSQFVCDGLYLWVDENVSNQVICRMMDQLFT